MGKLILLIALITKHPSIILTMHEAGTQPHKMSLSVTDGIEYQFYEGRENVVVPREGGRESQWGSKRKLIPVS